MSDELTELLADYDLDVLKEWLRQQEGQPKTKEKETNPEQPSYRKVKENVKCFLDQ